MSRGENEVRYEIFFLCIKINYTDSPALLLAVFGWIGTLYIAAFGQDEHRLFICDQILGAKFLDSVLDYLCPAIVAILGANVCQFCLDDATDFLFRTEDRLQLFYESL